MIITLESIPHKSQRYPTTGDYYTQDGLTRIVVSEELSEDHQFLVLLHELIEWYLTTKSGISEESITDFDVEYEKARDAGWAVFKGAYISEESEPGDHPRAPYYWAHQFATAIERMVAHELCVHWQEYEKANLDLYEGDT